MYLPSSGTLVAGKYQLESLLGEGGMGAVYRARHVLMDKHVALKWLRPELCGNAEARERLIREARSVARVRHPNVVQVYDVDSFEGSLFMVMELLEGQTFADLVANQTLTAQRVIELLTGAMYGLAAAHDHGVIHRDIKPENIFVVSDRQHPDGIAKLLDFGISKLDEHAGNPRLTQTGLSIGTPLYMSVEQLTRTDEVDKRSDIYSLGVVLYHALSGTLPFDGETFAGVVLSIATTRPVPLRRLRPELPAALDRVVMKAMARRREDRYATVHELISALRAIEDPFGHAFLPVAFAASRTPGPPGPEHDLDESLAAMLGEQKASTRRKVAVALTVAVLLLLGGSIGLYRSGRPAAVGVSAPPSLPPPVPSEPVVPAAPPPDPMQLPSTGTSPAQSPSPKVPTTAPLKQAAKPAPVVRAKSARSSASPGPASEGERGLEPVLPRAAARPDPRPPAPAAPAEASPTQRAAPSSDKPSVPTAPRVPGGKSGGLLREDF